MTYIIVAVVFLIIGAIIAALVVNKYHIDISHEKDVVIDALKTESAHIKTELANLKTKLG